MCKYKLSLFFLFLSTLSFGQTSFGQLVAETNKYLEEYDKLTPFGEEYVSLNDFDLTKKEKKEIIAELIKEEYALSPGQDSVELFYMISYFQDRILLGVDKILAHEKLKEHNLVELLNTGELGIVQSDDHKLYNFSLDEKTGGTYRSRISWMYYTELPDSLSRYGGEGEVTAYTVFEGDGFDEIFSIPTEQGIKYVLTGSVRGCSYCFESHIILVKFEDGIFKQEFAYSVNSRSWESGVDYDHETQTIEVEYETDDLATECDCYSSNMEKEEEYYEEEEEEYQDKKCQCTFVFKKGNFELVKSCWEILEDRE